MSDQFQLLKNIVAVLVLSMWTLIHLIMWLLGLSAMLFLYLLLYVAQNLEVLISTSLSKGGYLRRTYETNSQRLRRYWDMAGQKYSRSKRNFLSNVETLGILLTFRILIRNVLSGLRIRVTALRQRLMSFSILLMKEKFLQKILWIYNWVRERISSLTGPRV